MPIWLRRITFNLIREHYEKENEEIEKQNKMLNNSGKNEISRPNIVPPKPPSNPTYTAKAPKK